MKTQRLAYLDGLRGIAAVLVVIHHLMIGFYPATYTRTSEVHSGGAVEWILHDTPLGIVINGGLAVALFLLLSGYVLSLQFDSWENFSAVPTTTIKRLSRFFFLILACNVLAWGLIALGQTWNHQAAQITGSWWWLGAQWRMTPSFVSAVIQSWQSLFQFFPIGEFYNSSLWTMPFFFVGALLVTGLFILGHTFRRRWIVYGVALLLLMNSYYYFLIVGMLLYELHKHAHIERLPWWVMCFVGIATLYFGNYPQSYATSSFSLWYRWLPIFPFIQTSSFYHSLAATGILLVIFRFGYIQKLFSGRMFVYLGQRSFSLYVFHVIAINSVTSFLFVQLFPVLPYSTAFGMSVLLTIPLILLASEGLYRFVELQSHRFSDLISHRLLGYNTFYGNSTK